jgi:hypothetical protein
MFVIEITKEDSEWVKNNYPDLIIEDTTPTRLIGVLSFRALIKNKLPEIQDKYQIEIEFVTSPTSSLPRVRETGGRIAKVAQDKNLELSDLHVNPKDGTLCLCSPLEEDSSFYNGFNLEEFFVKLLIPFFYDQSYFETNNQWSWKHYSHGYLGIFESYAFIKQTDYALTEKCIDLLKQQYQQAWKLCRQLLNKKDYVKGHWPCICGSSLMFRKCHYEVLEGLRKLKQDITVYSILI